MTFPTNAHFHVSANLVSSAGTLVATAGGASSNVVEVTPTRGGQLSFLFIRFTASRAVNITTDALYVTGHETSSATGIRYRDLYTDVSPTNLLTAFDGLTDIDLIFPFRESPFNAIQFATSGTAITLTADADIVIETPTR